MPRTRTTTDLLQEARRVADLERDVLFITDAEGIGYLNIGLQALYDKLVAAYGDDYFEEEEDLTVASGDSSFALPDTFFKFLGLDYWITPSQAVTLLPYRRLERNMYRSAPAITWYGPEIQYRIKGGRVNLIGQSSSGSLNLTLQYVPTMPLMQVIVFAPAAVDIGGDKIALPAHLLRDNQTVRLTSQTTGTVPGGTRSDTDYYVIVTDGDNIQLASEPDGAAIDLTSVGTGNSIRLDTCFDGINGWERFATLSAGIQMLIKGEEDTTAFVTERATLEARLDKMIQDRDASMPARVQDVDNLRDQQTVRMI